MTALSPLAVQNEPLLRALKAGHTINKAIAEATGVLQNNINRKLDALAAEGLIHGETRTLTPPGVAMLDMLDRAYAAPRAGSRQGDSATQDNTPPGFAWVTLADLLPDPENARQSYDDAETEALADAMADKGLLQKPPIRPRGDDGLHRMIAGGRRYRAWARLIERGVWPADHRELCPVFDFGAEAAFEEASLLENLARVDLSPLDEAAKFEQLITRHGHTTETLAERTHRTQRFVQQRLQLLKLKPKDREALADGSINIEEARKRLAAYPKPFELTPADLLVFLEVADRAAREGKDIGYGQWIEVDYLVAEDAGTLSDRLYYTDRDWQTHLHRVCLFGSAAQALLQFTGADHPDAEALAGPLAAARKAAGADDLLDGIYATAWLNAPYRPDPAAVERARAAEADAAGRQAEIDAERAAQDAERKRIDAMIAAETEAGAGALAQTLNFPDAASAAGLGDLMAALGYRGPFTVRRTDANPPEPVIHDAAGKPLVAYRGAMFEALRRALCIGLNMACGFEAGSGPAFDPSDAETPEDDDDDDDDGEGGEGGEAAEDPADVLDSADEDELEEAEAKAAAAFADEALDLIEPASAPSPAFLQKLAGIPAGGAPLS